MADIFESAAGQRSGAWRRQVVDVAANFPKNVGACWSRWGAVYSFDAEVKERGLTPGERLTFHQSNGAPVMDELHQWLKIQFAEHKTGPNSGQGKAISYLLRRWPELTLFLRQAGASLDKVRFILHLLRTPRCVLRKAAPLREFDSLVLVGKRRRWRKDSFQASRPIVSLIRIELSPELAAPRHQPSE